MNISWNHTENNSLLSRTFSQHSFWESIPLLQLHNNSYLSTKSEQFLLVFNVVIVREDGNQPRSGHLTFLMSDCRLLNLLNISFCIALTTLGAETFASRKIREMFAFHEHKLSRIGQNRIFRVLNFREWTEKLIFFVVLRKRLNPDRNKREKKTLFQAFVVLGLVFVHQTFF